MTDTTLPANPVTVNDIVDPTLERDQFEYYTNLQLDQFEGEPFVWVSKRRKSAAKYMIKSRVGGNYIDKTLDALDKTHNAISFVSFCAYWTEVRRECETYEEIQKEAVANLRATNRPRSALGREDLRTAKVVAYSADYHQGRGQAELTLRGKGIDQIYPITPAHQDWPIIAACGFDFIGETEVENFTYNGVVIPKQMRHTCDFTITYKYVRNGSENELRVESLVMNADQQSFNTSPNAAAAQVAADMAGIKKGAFGAPLPDGKSEAEQAAAREAIAAKNAALAEQAAAMAAKEDEKPAASEPKVDIDVELGRKPAPSAAKHWGESDDTRKAFWGHVSSVHAYWCVETEKDSFAHNALAGEDKELTSIKQYKGTLDQAKVAVSEYGEILFTNRIRFLFAQAFKTATKGMYIESTGDQDVKDSLSKGKEPFDILCKVEGWIDSKAQTAPQTPETAPQVNETSAKAIETPARPELAIVARDVVSAESPVVVYPSEKGEVISGGIRYSVTMRAGATAEMAINAIHEWDRFWQLAKASGIAHVSEVRQVSVPTQPPAPVIPFPNQPMNNPPQPSAPASTNGGTPDKKGRIPGQKGTMQVAYVQRKSTDGKESYELWTAQGQYSDFSLRRESDVNMLRGIMPYPLENMQYGTKYPINLVAEWTVMGKLNQRGNYFTDVTALRNV